MYIRATNTSRQEGSNETILLVILIQLSSSGAPSPDTLYTLAGTLVGRREGGGERWVHVGTKGWILQTIANETCFTGNIRDRMTKVIKNKIKKKKKKKNAATWNKPAMRGILMP